ncbi:MAG: DNA polymerase III subunit delta [Mycoplasmoidaceae bacterium]
MVTIYHSANVDAINWKIFTDNSDKVINYLPSNSKAVDVANQLCQYSLFDEENQNKVYVVNVTNWKFTDNSTKQCIKDLHAIDKSIIFTYETATIKNKIFSELKIKAIKATAVTKKSKADVVHKLLSKAKIKLDSDVEQLLVDLLPDNIDLIRSEILKLQLTNQNTFTKNEIETIVFDTGDATVFNIVDSWLKGDEQETIARLNELLAKNITIQVFLPIFILKLVQIKLFLSAKLERWSPEIIIARQGIPFWQQRNYADLRPYDQKLDEINKMLKKLYQFDINVKKQKNIPYTQLIKILFN